jgi:DNA-binding NarL/FixJ family response regulator
MNIQTNKETAITASLIQTLDRSEEDSLQEALNLKKRKSAILGQIHNLNNELQKMEEAIAENLAHVFPQTLPTKQKKGRRTRGRSRHQTSAHKRGPKPLSTPQKIERILQKYPEGLSVPEIAKAAKKSESHIYNSMRKNGTGHEHPIVSLGHGRWGINPKLQKI